MHLQESAEMIALNAKHVKINKEELYKLTDRLLEEIQPDERYMNDFVRKNMGPWPDENYPPISVSDWMFVVNLLNFGYCTKPKPKCWEYGRDKGYYTISSAVNTALQRGTDIANPKYYSKLSKRKLKLLLNDSKNISTLFMNRRLEALRDSGEVLLKYFDGTFENCVREANGSALRLLDIITIRFRFFYDAAMYEGRTVAFHSRAQMLIINIWSYYENKGLGRFNDIHLLTSSTCYRIPQLFWFYGIFEYKCNLKSKIVHSKYLESGSQMEVEIRGCTIHTVEMMKNKIRLELGDYINPAYMNQLLIRLWRHRAWQMFKSRIYHHLTQSIHY